MRDQCLEGSGCRCGFTTELPQSSPAASLHMLIRGAGAGIAAHQRPTATVILRGSCMGGGISALISMPTNSSPRTQSQGDMHPSISHLTALLGEPGIGVPYIRLR